MSKSRDNKKLVVGLDIGTSKIAAIVAEIKPGGRLRDHRHGQLPGARAEERRRRQHRDDGERDPARARGSGAHGRLQDPRGLHRDRGQPHQELQLAGHGRDQGQGSRPAGHRPRDRDREGRADPERPADPAHPQPGIHHRRPGGRARAARHVGRAPRSQGAHRHRRGVGRAEHHQVRAPLRPRSERSHPAAARVRDGGRVGRREGPRRRARRHRRRHDRSRDLHARRDPPHRGDPDRGRPDHQRHRDGAAHADEGRRGPEAALRLRAVAARRSAADDRSARHRRARVARAFAQDARRSDRAARRRALFARAGGAAPQRLRGAAVLGHRHHRRLEHDAGHGRARRRDLPHARARRACRTTTARSPKS